MCKIGKEMNFSAVVARAKQLLGHEGEGSSEAGGQFTERGEGRLIKDVIYGRVCSTRGEEPPVTLSSDLSRKSVFLFGPDAVESIIVQQSGYNIMCSIGYDKNYLYHTVVQQKSTFWLVLFTPDAPRDSKTLTIAPATWDGVVQHVRDIFPDAYDDLLTHLQTLKENRFAELEEEAGFQFLEAKKNKNGEGGPGSPSHFSYEHFCSLPKPRLAWQVRAFLYCELRLLKLFTGDGYTCNEGAKGRRILEYLGPNVRISELDPAKCSVLRMSIESPDLIGTCHS